MAADGEQAGSGKRRMQFGLDQDRLAGLELERRSVLTALEQRSRNALAWSGVPEVGGHNAVNLEAPASEAAQRDLVSAALGGYQPAGQANREVFLRQARRKVAEQVYLAGIDVPARHRCADRLLAAPELDCEAGFAVEVAHVHGCERRQEEVDPAARLVDDLDAGEGGPKPVERGHGGRRRNVGGSAALRARLGRVGPDDRKLSDAGRSQRQDPVVGEQDERLGRGPAHERGGVGVGKVPRLRRIELGRDAGAGDADAIGGQHPDPGREKQHPARLVVQDRLTDLAPSNRLGQGGPEPTGRSGHLEVQPRHGRGDRVVHRLPVGHQDAVPGPLSL